MPVVGAGRRFAEAAFEIATRDGNIDEWRRDLRIACDVASNEEAARAIDSPAVPFAVRRQAVEELLGKRVSRLVLNLALMLAARGRFSLLPQIGSEFDALVRRSRGIVAGSVTTPRTLSPDELDALRKRVEEIAGAQVELSTEIEPELIGGLRVRIGDYQIDASVASRLMRLRKELVQGTSS